MRRNDERDDKKDHQRSDEAIRLHIRNMENNTYKSHIAKRKCGRGRKLPTDLHTASAVQIVLNKYNRLYDRLDRVQTREGFGVRTRRLIILQHTDCLRKNARSGVSKCGSRFLDFMKAFDSISHKSLWTALEKCGIEPQYISQRK